MELPLDEINQWTRAEICSFFMKTPSKPMTAEQVEEMVVGWLRNGESVKTGHRYWVELYYTRSKHLGWGTSVSGNWWRRDEGFDDFWDVVRYIERTSWTGGDFRLTDAVPYGAEEQESMSYITLLIDKQLRVWDDQSKEDISREVEAELWNPRHERKSTQPTLFE